MKIIKDEDLPPQIKEAYLRANKIGDSISKQLNEFIINQFNNDDEIKNFNYCQIISYPLKIVSRIFLNGVIFAHDIAKHFPDAETNLMELFEEAHAGLRVLSGFKEKPKEYINGIKRINTK